MGNLQTQISVDQGLVVGPVAPISALYNLMQSEMFKQVCDMYDEFRIKSMKVKIMPMQTTNLPSGQLVINTAWDRNGNHTHPTDLQVSQRRPCKPFNSRQITTTSVFENKGCKIGKFPKILENSRKFQRKRGKWGKFAGKPKIAQKGWISRKNAKSAFFLLS